MIPRVLHQIWLGGNPLKSDYRLSFMLHNPSWNFLLWTDDNLVRAGLPKDLYDLCRDERICYVVRSDILRLALVYLHGGVYSDMDMKCLKPLDGLLTAQSFAGDCGDGNIGNAFFGAEAAHSVIGGTLSEVVSHVRAYPDRCNRDPSQECGVSFQTPYFSKLDVIHPVHYFYPFHWKNKDDIMKEYPDSYTEHYWHGMAADGWVNKRF